MFQDAYIKLDSEETTTLVTALNPHFAGSVFDPKSSIIMARNLPFYKGYRFLDIADHKHMPANRRYVLQKENRPIDKAAQNTPANDTIVLDFSNAPIYDLNKQALISLTKDNVTDYVRFFFSFVRGRHGRFLIVETIDNIPWRDEPAPAARKAISRMIAPIALSGKGLDGSFQLGAQMLFKDSLFTADINVQKDGFVKIGDERLLVEDMPVIDDVLGQ